MTDIEMPLSVLLAICSNVNTSNMAQMRASAMTTKITPQLRAQLLTLATMMSNSETKNWIRRELEAFSEEPEP